MLKACHWEGCYRTNTEGVTDLALGGWCYRPGIGRGVTGQTRKGVTDLALGGWCDRPGNGRVVTGSTLNGVTGRALGVAVTGLALGGN